VQTSAQKTSYDEDELCTLVKSRTYYLYIL